MKRFHVTTPPTFRPYSDSAIDSAANRVLTSGLRLNRAYAVLGKARKDKTTPKSEIERLQSVVLDEARDNANAQNVLASLRKFPPLR